MRFNAFFGIEVNHESFSTWLAVEGLSDKQSATICLSSFGEESKQAASQAPAPVLWQDRDINLGDVLVLVGVHQYDITLGKDF
jgi:hypothetical protein